MFILQLYVDIVLGTTDFIYQATGLYPYQQLEIARGVAGVPDSAGVLDTALALLS